MFTELDQDSESCQCPGCLAVADLKLESPLAVLAAENLGSQLIMAVNEAVVENLARGHDVQSFVFALKAHVVANLNYVSEHLALYQKAKL